MAGSPYPCLVVPLYAPNPKTYLDTNVQPRTAKPP